MESHLFPLLDCDEMIQRLIDELSLDSWILKKTNRTRRLHEHYEYLMKMLPEVWSIPGKFVDLGPGPGESLEIAACMGNETIGIDPSTGRGGMGDKYLAYSMLMHVKQRLSVWYCGAWEMESVASDVRYINSRGSIEQIMHEYMIGRPHDQHQSCRALDWDEGTIIQGLTDFLAICHGCMTPGGIMAIQANGAGNEWIYTRALPIAANKAGFSRIEIYAPLKHRLHS